MLICQRDSQWVKHLEGCSATLSGSPPGQSRGPPWPLGTTAIRPQNQPLFPPGPLTQLARYGMSNRMPGYQIEEFCHPRPLGLPPSQLLGSYRPCAFSSLVCPVSAAWSRPE